MFDILRLVDSASDPYQKAFLGSFVNAPREVWEKDGVTYVELEVPGVRAEDVDVTAQDGVLKVSWTKKVRGSQEKSYRQYRLSEDTDLENVRAEVADGLLTLELRRHPKPAPRKIPVLGSAGKSLGE